MAEEQDDSQKTEEPSQRKLDQAREKGQVASSQEVKHGFVLLGGLIVVAALAPVATGEIADRMAGFLGRLEEVPTGNDALIDLFGSTIGEIALIMLAPFVVLFGMAIAGSLVQSGPLLSAESLKPKFEKISPMKGLKRQFSIKAVAEFAKGILKIAIVGAVATVVVWPEFARIELFAGMPMSTVLERVWVLSVKMMTAVLAIMALIAGLDYLLQRYQFNQQQRMTKQEVKDEFKQTEGDPMVKGRLRQIRMDRARRRIIAAVPEADVVITNPTHFAVAMAYDPETMDAPKVVAKGADQIALRIREVAEEHDVAVIENPPLARALYGAVEIDQSVPPEHYKAVAEVISYVFRLQGRTM